MNLIIVTGLLNYPLESGGDVVTFKMIEGLSKLHRLTVLYPAYKNVEKNRAEMQALLPGVELIVFNHDKKHYTFGEKLRNRIRPILEGIRSSVMGALTPTIKEREDDIKETFFRNYDYIEEVIKAKYEKGEVDLVQVEYPWMMGLVDRLPKALPKIYTAIELTFHMVREKAATMGDPVMKKYWERKSQFIRETEIALGSKYDAIFTISAHDEEIWRQALPNQQIIYSPSGIDTEFYKARKPIEKFDRVVFIGHGKHHANVDAVEVFFKGIYPLLKQAIPDVKVLFTGVYDQQIKDRFPKDANITWTGFVDDLRDVLDGSISIAPMRIGSGLRIKILESMSYGCPVITTEIGHEGIPCTDGYDIFVRDNPADFAQAIISLLKDQGLAHRISANARATIVKNFELTNVVSARDEAFRRVVAKHS